MGNRIGTFQLELYYPGQDTPAVIGTDGIMTIDGRWTMHRAYDHIAQFARECCTRKGTDMEWRGTIYLLGGRKRSVKVSSL